jgi:hypothetical protein
MCSFLAIEPCEKPSLINMNAFCLVVRFGRPVSQTTALKNLHGGLGTAT